MSRLDQAINAQQKAIDNVVRIAFGVRDFSTYYAVGDLLEACQELAAYSDVPDPLLCQDCGEPLDGVPGPGCATTSFHEPE